MNRWIPAGAGMPTNRYFFGLRPHCRSHPMPPRDSNIPLIVALLIVLAGHAAAVPWFAVLLDPQGTPGRASPPGVELDASAQRAIELGRDQTRASQVAWIPYEDYRELMAPEASSTRQPALQREVDPVDQAPLELDPTPPNPAAASTAPATPPTESADAGEAMDALPESDALSKAPPAATPLPVPPTEADTPFRQPTRRAAEHHPESAQREARDTQAPPAHESADESPRPTAAPRSESEAMLTDLTAATHRVQPGRVLTLGDIEIQPQQPRFSAVARRSAVPRNPIAEVTFAPDGSVRDVELSRTTGYSNVDAPLRRSLYAWRAVGAGLERIDEPFTLTFEIILIAGGR